MGPALGGRRRQLGVGTLPGGGRLAAGPPYHGRVAPSLWLDEDEDRAWRSWIQATLRVQAAVARDLAREHGLSDAEYAVLVTLSEAPGREVRMRDLAARLGWSRSRLSHLLTRMEGRGSIERRGCPSDARGAFAHLTDAGQAEIEAAAPGHVASVRRHFLAHLDRDQLRALAELCGALAGSDDDLDAACAEGCTDEAVEPA